MRYLTETWGPSVAVRHRYRVVPSKHCHRPRPHHFGARQKRKRLLHSIIRVSAKAAAWIQHTSCTHRIAGCRDRSRIVGRQMYSARRLYRLYQDPRGCQSVSGSRAHWCSKTKAMPDRQRQVYFSRVPKKRSKQEAPSRCPVSAQVRRRNNKWGPHDPCCSCDAHQTDCAYLVGGKTGEGGAARIPWELPDHLPRSVKRRERSH